MYFRNTSLEVKGALVHRQQHLTACLIQNTRQGLETSWAGSATLKTQVELDFKKKINKSQKFLLLKHSAPERIFCQKSIGLRKKRILTKKTRVSLIVSQPIENVFLLLLFWLWLLSLFWLLLWLLLFLFL